MKTVGKLPPLHPGEMLREEFLKPMGLTPRAVAKACGVPRTRIERIVRCAARRRERGKFLISPIGDFSFLISGQSTT